MVISEHVAAIEAFYLYTLFNFNFSFNKWYGYHQRENTGSRLFTE